MSTLVVRVNDREYTALSDIRYYTLESDLIHTLKNKIAQMLICPRVLIYNDNLEIVGALLPYVVNKTWSVCFTSFKSMLFRENMKKFFMLDSTTGVRYHNNAVDFTKGHILVALYYSIDVGFSYVDSDFITLEPEVLHLLFIDLRSGKYTILDDAANALKSGTISDMLHAHESEFINAKFENDKFILTLANSYSGEADYYNRIPVTSLAGCDIEIEAAKVVGLGIASYPVSNFFMGENKLFYNVELPENPLEDKLVIPDISFPARLLLPSAQARLPKSLYLGAFSEAGIVDLSSFDRDDDDSVQIFLSRGTKCSFLIKSVHARPKISLIRKEPAEYDCLAGIDMDNRVDFHRIDWRLKVESIGSVHLDMEGTIPCLDFRFINDVTGSIRGIIGHAYFKMCSNMQLDFANMLFSGVEFEACALRDVKSLRFTHSLLLSKCDILTKDDYVNLGDGNYGYLKLVLSDSSIAVRSSGAVLSNLDIIGDETKKVRINGVFQVREANLSCCAEVGSDIVLIKPCQLTTSGGTSCISCLTIKGLPVAVGIGYVLSWTVFNQMERKILDNIWDRAYNEFTWTLDVTDHSDECMIINFAPDLGTPGMEVLDSVYKALYLLTCVNIVRRPNQRVLFNICVSRSVVSSVLVGDSKDIITLDYIKKNIIALNLADSQVISKGAGLCCLDADNQHSFAANLTRKRKEALLLACKENFEKQGIDLGIAINIGLDYFTPENKDVQFKEAGLITNCRTIYT